MKPQTFKVTYEQTRTENGRSISKTVSKMEELVDRVGNAIQVGQIITYPVRRGSYMSMEFAMVDSIERSDYGSIVLHCHKANDTNITIFRWDRCVVINAPVSNYGF